MIYLNEWDKGAAAWLRELQYAGHIPPGIVDERSITEVTKEDLAGFTQCHFFAGIGGWPLALQKAGVPATVPLWTGSPPCQPFSVAGKQLGKDDPRHLAPAFLELIAQCRPQLLFGEQVAAAIGKHWLDALLIELEEQDYTCGAAVLPACSVGAPHKRDRLFFGASLELADTCGHRVRMRSSESAGAKGEVPRREEQRQRLRADTGAVRADISDELADSMRTKRNGGRLQGSRESASKEGGWQAAEPTGCCDIGESANPHHGFWSDADWLGCRDGKFRPVEPGTFPLANGISARVGRLRGYGNAIVPQAAAEFIKAFKGAIADQKEKAAAKN